MRPFPVILKVVLWHDGFKEYTLQIHSLLKQLDICQHDVYIYIICSELCSRKHCLTFHVSLEVLV